jgi:hypothetical protein
MRRSFLFISAALLLCACSKPKQAPQIVRLQVTTAGMFMGAEKLPSDEPVRLQTLSRMMDSGAWDRDVRIDFAANVPCEVMKDTIVTVLVAGAGNGNGQLGFGITGDRGLDFLLEISDDYGWIMEYEMVADEWGTAMIDKDGRRLRTVEFDVQFADGCWGSDGVLLEVEDLGTMLRHRRTQGSEAIVSIFTDTDTVGGDLLPLLLACQAEGVRFKLAGDPEVRGEWRKQFRAQPVLRVIPEFAPGYAPGEEYNRSHAKHRSVTWSVPPPLLPEQFIMSACPCGAGEGR